MSAESSPALDAALEAIAKKQLGVETLERRNADSLDFHDCSVWSLRAALMEAFELGRREAAKRS